MASMPKNVAIDIRLMPSVREALADAWDEGAKWAAVEFAVLDQGVQFLAPGDNPYREASE